MTTVVVGSGPAGCAVARRLAERGRDVLLLEAGASAAPDTAGVLDLGPGSTVVRRWPATLGDTELHLPRGHTVGGSGAVNGGYCLPARPHDLDFWPPYWPRRYAQGLARAVERLRPRLVDPDPVAARLARAWPGATTRVPQARHGRLRRTPVAAWDPVGAGARLRVGAPGARLSWSNHPGGRCDGVWLADGTAVPADEVWLTAGALGTAEILLASGIGPATGHAVGEGAEEHPEILLEVPDSWSPPVSDGPPPPLLSAVTRLRIADRVVELRPYSVPVSWAIPGAPADPHRIGVALMDPRGRAALRCVSPGPGHGPPRVVVDLSAHPDPADAAALSRAVDEVRDRLGLTGPASASTSQHLSGTARLGEVVDDDGRLLGATGVRVADASVLPTLPSCGPYLTVAAVAEALVAGN